MIPFSKLQITIFGLISVLIVGSTLTFGFFQSSKDKAGGFNSQNSNSNNISKNQNPSQGNSANSNSLNSLGEVQNSNVNSLAPSTSNVKLVNSDSQETKAQNETATFKLADFSDDSLKKVTMDNIIQDTDTGSFMKDCLSSAKEPRFKKEVFYSKTLNKNYITVNFGSICDGNAGSRFGLIKVDSDGSASFLLEPRAFPSYDMKAYLSPNSDKIALEKTYKFIGCFANSYVFVMDLKTEKDIYDSFKNSTSTDRLPKTKNEQTMIQEKVSKWLNNGNLEILTKAKTADFGSHTGCNDFQDKALQTKIIKI